MFVMRARVCVSVMRRKEIKAERLSVLACVLSGKSESLRREREFSRPSIRFASEGRSGVCRVQRPRRNLNLAVHVVAELRLVSDTLSSHPTIVPPVSKDRLKFGPSPEAAASPQSYGSCC